MPTALTTEGAPATDNAAAPATDTKLKIDRGETVVAKTDDTVDGKAGSYAVAAGRTVHHDGKDYLGQRRNPKNEIVPADKVKLDADDAERLLKAGFLLDKDGAAIIHADGPAVNVDNGVQLAPSPA